MEIKDKGGDISHKVVSSQMMSEEIQRAKKEGNKAKSLKDGFKNRAEAEAYLQKIQKKGA